jgi:(p)ppGpp synthase/HD superfamily hydrolase
MTTQTQIARAISRLAHNGQSYGSATYFDGHIAKVVQNAANNPEAGPLDVPVAYLHDVLEDTSTTAQDLVNLGVARAVVRVVASLTRRRAETYFEYVERVAAAGGVAARVKTADLRANLYAGRDDASKESLRRRYELALVTLAGAA